MVTIYPSVPSSFVPASTAYFPVSKYFPSSSSKFSWLISPPFAFVNAPVADNSTFSFSSANSVCSFASVAFVKIPLSPVNVTIVTPAKINKTIMFLIFIFYSFKIFIRGYLLF